MAGDKSMKNFHEMLRKVTSSPSYDSMLCFVANLHPLFGINHFWYYRITNSGHYSYLGTHARWNEFCFDTALLGNFPCLRHPNALPRGINLMKADASGSYKELLQTAWEKFNINFNINLLRNIPQGVEAFGFATCYNDPRAEERLINSFPYLRHFAVEFRKRYKKLFHLLDDYQINLSSELGTLFYEFPKGHAFPCDRKEFLRKMGLESILSLTSREKEIFLLSNYPAPYIAQRLELSQKTVENNLLVIKEKLACDSKVTLIQKQEELTALNYFDDFLHEKV
jgi:DNA-binding CsgD family transcriptional regulator